MYTGSLARLLFLIPGEYVDMTHGYLNSLCHVDDFRDVNSLRLCSKVNVTKKRQKRKIIMR